MGSCHAFVAFAQHSAPQLFAFGWSGESPALRRFRSAASAEQPQPEQRQFAGIPGGR